MFDSLDADRLQQECSLWRQRQVQPKWRFLLPTTVSMASLACNVIFAARYLFGHTRLHGPLLIFALYGSSLLIGYAASELLWRRGLRLATSLD